MGDNPPGGESDDGSAGVSPTDAVKPRRISAPQSSELSDIDAIGNANTNTTYVDTAHVGAVPLTSEQGTFCYKETEGTIVTTHEELTQPTGPTRTV